MKKRILCLLLCLILLLVGVIPGIACAAAVSSSGGSSDHTHTPSEWRTTQVYHYKVCTSCGEMLEDHDHTGGVATCAEKGKCTVCGYEYIDTHENHTPDTSKWVARGDMYHFHKCSLCGAHCDIEDHRWSPKPHVADANGHAYQCADCKACDTQQPHNPGPAATETTPQTCKDCGYIIAPAIQHTHKLTLTPEVAPTCTEPGVNAYYTCSGCDQRFADEAGKEPLEEGKDLTIPPQGHQISNDWGHNEDVHWRICAVCQEKMVETEMKHELQDGKCTTCEYDEAKPQATDPKDTEPEKEEKTKENDREDDREDEPEDLAWWMVLLIGVGAVAAGVVTGVLVLKLTKKKNTQ